MAPDQYSTPTGPGDLVRWLILYMRSACKSFFILVVFSLGLTCTQTYYFRDQAAPYSTCDLTAGLFQHLFLELCFMRPSRRISTHGLADGGTNHRTTRVSDKYEQYQKASIFLLFKLRLPCMTLCNHAELAVLNLS